MPSSASVPLLGQPTGSRQRSLDDRWDGFKAWLHEQGAKVADKWEATKDYGKSLTPFQRGLAIAGIVIIVLLLIPYSIAVYLIYHPPVHGPGSPISVPPPAPKSPLCVSPDCVLAAASILPSLNTSVDPCDDFYEFTCGNWLYSNPIADQEVSVSTWTEIRDADSNVVRSILESDGAAVAKTDADRQLFGKVKTLYKACVDESTIDKRGAAPVTTFLNEFLMTSFPVLHPVFPSGTLKLDVNRFAASLSALYEFEIRPFFDVQVEPSAEYALVNVPLLTPISHLGLGRKARYQNKRAVAAYKKVAAKALYVALDGVASALSVKKAKSEVDWQGWADKVVEFEVKLANVTPSYYEVTKKTRAETTLHELSTVAPKIPWLSIFHALFGRSVTAMDSVLIVGGLDYYKSVSDLLGEADLDVIEGYLLLLAVKSLSPFANQGLRQVFSPLSDLTGVSPTAEKARSDFCVDFLSETLNYALGKFFSTAAFNELAVASANDMFGRIKQSFDIGLNAAAWMDNVTLQEANQKSAVFEIITGYPSFINDTAYLKQRFALIDPKPKAFFEGVLQARQASAKDTFLLKDKERSREVQSRPIVSVFAKYTAQNNALFMPAGLLQPSCFSPTWPSFFNYGACGSIASELIMRGFDYDGSLYDAEGNKRDWWSPRTREDFEAKAQCFVDQYSEYSVSFPSGETFFIDGLLTRETNIKTTAGLANTYYAWQAERGDKDGALRNPALPGLGDFTDEQLFFISFGKQRCEKLRDEILYERLKVGDYTPPRYQVNGAVSQVDSFARAFSCPIGSKMNPKKKCSLW